ncbi:MAG: phytanoyl-CoA dioxygenase family protein [Actinobacteria bacterium]|uniref:Unannotated protein n=1 Tax=freshwater metagenome TaxID=449393 RepID=A0A6J7L2F3_9ZZZZ|nr:phytanoyl-CoA dioxygenase family protein [Actinomycetota bacterium]
MGLTTLAKSSSNEEVIEIIERDGGVIISDFVSPEVLAAIRDDIRAPLDAIGFGSDDFSGNRTRRLGRVFQHTKHAVDVALEPHYQAAAKHFLEVPTSCYFGSDSVEMVASMQIGVTQVIEIYPGEGAQPLHRDDAIWQWRHPEGGRQARVQVMLAVTDFTAENGGTLVIPGSHKWDDERVPQLDEAVPTEMKAGSAVIFIGGTYHAGGTNNTNTPRTGLTLTLDIGWLRQEENHYLSLSREVVKEFPEEIQRLLGWGVCPPFLGWVEFDGLMTDPSVLLGDTPPVGADLTGGYGKK